MIRYFKSRMINIPFEHQSQSHLNHEQSLIHPESEDNPVGIRPYFPSSKTHPQREKRDESTEECNGVNRMKT